MKYVYSISVIGGSFPSTRKAKDFILAGKLQNVDLKLREPNEKWVWYFRINKQYRAYCTYRDNALRIYEINDHSR